MAQTTTAVNSCAAVVKLDRLDGTLTNISGSAASVTPAFGLTLGEYRGYADRWPDQLDGGRTAGVTLSVLYSTATDEGWDILRRWYFATNPGARSFHWYTPDETTAGGDHFSCEMRITDLKWQVDASRGGAIAATATLVPDGAVSWEVVT
jgi:hypothetical protein